MVASTITPPKPKRKPDPDSLVLPLVDEDMKNFIREHEGVKDFLYRDHLGNITAGPGFLVGNPKDAYALGFYHGSAKGKPVGRKASMKELERAFNMVKAYSPEFHGGAERYDPAVNNALPDLHMRVTDMERILEQKLITAEGELRRKIPNFDTIPRSGRKALLDMQYNMGDKEFRDKNWPKLYKAIDRRDWRKAASESHRKNVGPGRNQTIRELFMDADYWERRRRNP